MTKMRTTTNAPGLKMWMGLLAAVVTSLGTQTVVELPAWSAVLINAAAVAYAVWQATPQPTVSETTIAGPEAGHSLVELVVGVLLVLILVVVLLRLV